MEKEIKSLVCVYDTDVYRYPNLFVCPACNEKFSISSEKQVMYCPICGQYLLAALIINKASGGTMDAFDFMQGNGKRFYKGKVDDETKEDITKDERFEEDKGAEPKTVHTMKVEK